MTAIEAPNPASMQLDGVPESIRASKVNMWLRMLGISLNDVPRSSGGVRITGDMVMVDLFARNADGQRYLDGDDVAMHHVCIPVVRDT